MKIEISRRFWDMPFVTNCLADEDGGRLLLSALMIASLAADDDGFLVDDDKNPLTSTEIEEATGLYQDTVGFLLLTMLLDGAGETRDTPRGPVTRLLFPKAGCNGQCHEQDNAPRTQGNAPKSSEKGVLILGDLDDDNTDVFEGVGEGE